MVKTPVVGAQMLLQSPYHGRSRRRQVISRVIITVHKARLVHAVPRGRSGSVSTRTQAAPSGSDVFVSVK